jgi:hypothetical protein
MSDTTEDAIRREVGKLLRVDYCGKFMCTSCLLKLAVERFGTTVHTRGQIERVLDVIFRSPGAPRRVPTFVCDQCGQQCATAARSGLSA